MVEGGTAGEIRDLISMKVDRQEMNETINLKSNKIDTE
jgi:hypothetical protein